MDNVVCDYLWNNESLKNIIWFMTNLSDFRKIVPSFVSYAKRNQQKIVYIHFSEEEQLLQGNDSVFLKEIPLTHRFEAFTVAVYQTIRNEEEETLYLFDCLSDMQIAWATDSMIENFFRVIAPVIEEKHSIAFYPLIRGMHAPETMEEFERYTSLTLSLYADFKNTYLYSPKHVFHQKNEENPPFLYDGKEETFVPVTDLYLLSQYQRAVNLSKKMERSEHKDSWDRFFDETQQLYENGVDITARCHRMCQIMMSRDEQIRNMIRNNFKPVDYFFVKEHMVGTGLIGGKACGMLTARMIIENRRPDISNRLEAHDSFFIGSDVFYSYIVENNLWDLRVRQRKEEGYFVLAEELANGLLQGTFSRKMEAQFIHLLEYYGESPVIVRSSSILEDGFGNAFAGKYDSVFCPGVGTMEERLKEFEDAIRVVYASALSRSALDYRLRRGLENRDEQMSILVQRVSGSKYGDYYMPCAAGVGYSYSTYRFLESLDPNAGMLRLVAGLGTAAVDRECGSYPRLVSLDKPAATSFKTIGEHHRYSQQNVDLINKATGKMEQVPLLRLLPHLPKHLKKMVLQHDDEAERRFYERGERRDVYFISCAGLVKNEKLMKDMKNLLATLQKEYEKPVDIEYTINLSEDGEYIINLLQCRPLQVLQDNRIQAIPENLTEEEIFVDCRHTSMGLSKNCKIDSILYVDPIAYYNMPYQEKYNIAGIISKVNWHFRNQGKTMILMVPGRICTSSPELGVPTTFSDISEFSAIFEVAESRVGYNPELSYGSHIFQDLVENNILYMAVFEDEKTKCFDMSRIRSMENHLPGIDEDASKYADIISFYEMESLHCYLYHDMFNERLVCALHEDIQKKDKEER